MDVRRIGVHYLFTPPKSLVGLFGLFEQNGTFHVHRAALRGGEQRAAGDQKVITSDLAKNLAGATVHNILDTSPEDGPAAHSAWLRACVQNGLADIFFGKVGLSDKVH